MFINVKITSKNQNSLKFFLKDFKLLIKNKKLNSNKVLSVYHNKQTRKTFTILKSPHVNKKAQEQFEYRLYSKSLLIKSFQIGKLLIILKNFQKFLHPDIEIKIKFILKKQRINYFENLNVVKNKSVKIYLLMLTFYGNKFYLQSK